MKYIKLIVHAPYLIHNYIYMCIYIKYIYYCVVVWWGNEVTQIKKNFEHFNLNQYKTHISLKK